MSATTFDPYATPAVRVTRSTIHEAHFDLWGLSVAWIAAINDALHEYTEPSQGDTGESYTCEANMSFRFQSTDLARVQQAERIFSRLYNLAKRTESRKAYHRICG